MAPEMSSERQQSKPFFTKDFDRRVWITLAVVLISAIFGISLTVYTAWPSNYRIGYKPKQPIEFSHQLHAGSLQINCRYCHTQVDRDAAATIPNLDICMNCHRLFKPDAKKKQQVQRINVLMRYWNEKKPVLWNRVYDVSDFAHFYHNRHVNAGLDCSNCHGQVETMPIVEQVSPLTMGWCIGCHKGNSPLRLSQEAIYLGKKEIPIVKDPVYGSIAAPLHCSTCHW